MLKKILVPIDGSEHAHKAVDFAANMAVQNEAGIHLLHVVSPAKIPEEIVELARAEHVEGPPTTAYLEFVGNRILHEAERRAKEKAVSDVETSVMEGDPAEVIIDYAKKGMFDMIVIGSRGLGSVKGLFLGSVSSKVCHATDRTCVTVK